MNDFDTTEKVEKTDVGFRLTVESTRGTGTRDQDKVKAEYRKERMPVRGEIDEIIEDVQYIMDERRAHHPDGDSE